MNLTDIDTGHREGCAFGRTARCTCTYLTQWDKTPEYTAPTWPVAYIPNPSMTQAEAESLFKEPGTRERCTSHPYSWHFTEPMNCAEFEEELLGSDGFSELIRHPEEFVQMAGRTYAGHYAACQQEVSDEKLRTKYWYGEYKDVRRRFIGMFTLALAGWAFSIARGIWGF